MKKKLIVGTAALTTVAVGGSLYYRWVRTRPLDLFLEDETDDKPDWDKVLEPQGWTRKESETQGEHLA